MSIDSKIGRFLVAGVWFGVAAIFPAAYYLLRFSDTGLPILGGSVALAAFAPVALSAVCGALLGSTILEPETKTPFGAALRGLMVGVVSFVLLFTIPLLISLPGNPDIIGTVVGFGVIFLYGLFIAGWLVAIVGTIAGWVLYLVALRIRR